MIVENAYPSVIFFPLYINARRESGAIRYNLAVNYKTGMNLARCHRTKNRVAISVSKLIIYAAYALCDVRKRKEISSSVRSDETNKCRLPSLATIL